MPHIFLVIANKPPDLRLNSLDFVVRRYLKERICYKEVNFKVVSSIKIEESSSIY